MHDVESCRIIGNRENHLDKTLFVGEACSLIE